MVEYQALPKGRPGVMRQNVAFGGCLRENLVSGLKDDVEDGVG